MKSRSTLSLTLSSSILPQSAGKRAELVLQLTFTRSAVKLPGKGYFEIKYVIMEVWKGVRGDKFG